MKPIIFALVGMFLYSFANILVDAKLTKFNSLTIMVSYSGCIFLLSFIARQVMYTPNAGYDFPSGITLGVMVAVGLLFFAADYFYISAYTNEGNLVAIVTIMALFPVVSSAIKFALTKSLPNWWQIGGYVLALVAILLVTKGSAK